MSIASAIKQARKGKMTQRELAEAIGKSFSSIQKYELGLATPPVHTLIKIADVLGVSLSDLTNLHISYGDSGKITGAVGFEDCLKPLITSMGYRINTPEENLCMIFRTLNEDGQKQAFVRVSDIARNPEFQKDVTSCQDQQKAPVQSENAQTDDGKQE